MPALPAEHPQASSGPRSRRTTDAPRLASSRATHTPTAPPPITVTSAFVVAFRVIRAWWKRRRVDPMGTGPHRDLVQPLLAMLRVAGDRRYRAGSQMIVAAVRVVSRRRMGS